MKNVFCLIILLSMLFLQSCSGLRSSVDLSVSTDRKALEFLQNRTNSINSLKASLRIKPADITVPAIDAYLDYEKDNTFRLTGLSPTGFTLFDIQVIEYQGQVISDSNLHGNDIFKPEILREMLDFYGSNNSPDTNYFIEEINDYYIVNQIRSDGGIAYPLRRWWIKRDDMVVVRKELYSNLQDNKGVRIFEAQYRDFKSINGIKIPVEIIIKDGTGNQIGNVRFNKVEYLKGINLKYQ